MHREVVQLVQQGRTAEEIIDAFVAQYGETVLMAPPKGGFNLVGYVLPGLGILGVGAAMLWMLMGRARTGGEAALLEKELGDLDL
jgi:cytochrome c-type biogenesis protein CcmH